MQDIQNRKEKLRQQKNKLAAKEIRLSIRERKMRTRHLIDVGGLFVKVGLDHLPINTLYGALLSLKDELTENEAVQEQWTELGRNTLDQETKTKIAVILKLSEAPTAKIRAHLRAHGMKWNRIRQEWYGAVTNIDSLTAALGDAEHQLEIIQ